MDALSTSLLDRALELAASSPRNTHPNPRVGCIVVRDGTVIGQGVTSDVQGGAHAEIEALADVRRNGLESQGVDVYVTLEPCSHTGRTPPCVKALIDARVSRVVYAMTDPNPAVNGQGIHALERAGIKTLAGSAAQAQRARQINRGFFSRMERYRPWLRVKLACSLDGRIAMASGESQWITGVAARDDVQQLRARADVVLTGVGTVNADNPALTVRDANGVARTRQPLRVIADSTLRTDVTSQLFDQPGDTLIAFSGEGGGREARGAALRARGAALVHTGNARQVALPVLLAELAVREKNEIHTECGGVLTGGLIQAGLVDELVVYFAPRLIGDAGVPSVALPNLESLAETPQFRLVDSEPVGDDLRVRLEIAR